MANDTSLVEETQGWKDLVDWLNAEPAEGEPKRNPNRLSKELKISQPAVRGWVERISRPTVGPLREALCRIIGSSPDRWITQEDREEAAKYAAIAPAPPASEERTGDIR